MSLTDVMSAMRLSQYPTIALVIFLAAFAAILLQALAKRRSEVEHEANMPLDDGVLRPEMGTHGIQAPSNCTRPTLAAGTRTNGEHQVSPHGSTR